MAGHSQQFPWPSYYGHFNFFETRMQQHSRVTSLTVLGNGTYELARTNGDRLRAFICECYAFGVADYMQTVENLGPLNAVIINSAWCGYSPDVKRYCRDQRVGLFTIGGFMAALNRKEYWLYLESQEKDYFRKAGWL